MVRADTSLEAISKLRPVFSEDGTLTAANSTALTDGASAVIIASEAAAERLNLTPLAAVRSWAYVGVDPADQLLIGPALAMPKALARAGLDLADMDRVELHEAFSAIVLCIRKALESDAFARDRLGRNTAVGSIGEERLNVFGGSVAIGHPFGATGGRMALTMARELRGTDARYALLGICAAGGLGAAAVLERV
jgi:acetyl-CoA acyltransferase